MALSVHADGDGGGDDDGDDDGIGFFSVPDEETDAQETRTKAVSSPPIAFRGIAQCFGSGIRRHNINRSNFLSLFFVSNCC